MKLTKEDLQQAYQHQTSPKGSERAACLSADELTRIAAGEVNAAERERAIVHLTACSDCAEEYRILMPLEDWAAQAAQSVAEERMPLSENALPKAVEAIPAPIPWVFGFWMRYGFAMAALPLAISVALGLLVLRVLIEQQRVVAQLKDERNQKDRAIAEATRTLEERQQELEEKLKTYEQSGAGEKLKEYEAQIAELNRDVEELSRPQLNVPITDLDPRDSVRGGSPNGVKTIDIPSGANFFTLILNILGEHQYASYALEVTDAQGRQVWNGSGLRKSPNNTFTVSLPRRLFPGGQYHFKLYGVNGGKHLVQDYTARVRYR